MTFDVEKRNSNAPPTPLSFLFRRLSSEIAAPFLSTASGRMGVNDVLWVEQWMAILKILRVILNSP